MLRGYVYTGECGKRRRRLVSIYQSREQPAASTSLDRDKQLAERYPNERQHSTRGAIGPPSCMLGPQCRNRSR